MKTKNIDYLKLGLFSFFIISFTACTKDSFLDVPPKGVLTDESTFNSQSNADLFVNDIYNNLPDGNGITENLDQWTDNSNTGATNQEGQSRIRSNALSSQNATGGPGGTFSWSGSYNKIRKCNVFLQNAEANKEVYDADWYTTRVAEVKFLRAFFYSILYENYGGVPLITIPLNNLDGSDIFTPRSSMEETLAFIEKDCDEAAADLPLTVGDGDRGRATKGAALMLKGDVELFAASPLVNTANAAAQWAKAASTYMSVMNLNVYSLFNDGPTAFKDQFLASNNWNPETIFARAYALPSKGHRREGTQGVVIVNGGQQAWGNISPTQNLVDDYQMDNGLPITDPASGYDPQDPYKNRESRFYQSIVYDGSTWQGDVFESRIGGNNQIDLGSTSDITNTGYNGRLTLDESIKGQTSLGTSPNTSNYQIYRFAETLLSYAEAQNEAAGPDASVYDAVNRVRARVSLPALPAGLTQDQMRAFIHRERRLEFAFQDKRWYDIRRWDITVKGPAVLNSPEYGMEITADAQGNLNYMPIIVFDNRYSEYMNLLPIPQDVLNQNTKLEQNPGY